jgi:hypothetical protein
MFRSTGLRKLIMSCAAATLACSGFLATTVALTSAPAYASTTGCAAAAGTSISDCNFENPALAAGNYAIDPTGGAWTFAGEALITSNSSAFHPPAAPIGTQAGIVKAGSGTGTISQAVTGWQAGVTYTLTLSAAERCDGTGSGPTFQLSLDSQLLGSYSATSCTYTDTSFTFTTTAGSHTLTFQSQPGTDFDTSSFIDNLRLTRSTPSPTSTNDCKNGGWQNLADRSGGHFKNQGDCVSYVATGGKNTAAG